MKNILFLFLFPVLFGLWGCKKSEEPISGTVFSENYVQVYQKISSFTGHYHGAYRAIRLDVEGDAITQMDSPEYTEIANSFNDNSYNQWLVPFSHIVILTEIDAIDAVSDTDFSAELTAGKSLGNVVKLYSLSPYNYIRSGYTDAFDWENNQPEEFKQENWGSHYGLRGNGSEHPVIKLLSEVTANDLMLLESYYFYLRFTEIPAIKQHKITVTLRIEGQELSTVVDVDFDNID